MNYINRLEVHIFELLRQNLQEPHSQEMKERDQQLVRLARLIVHETYLGDPAFFSPVVEAHSRIRLIEERYKQLEERVGASASLIIDELKRGFNRTEITCRMRDDDVSGTIAELIVTGGASLGAKDKGRTEADNFLSQWLEDAEEINILDPYLFKREGPRNDELAETKEERQAAEYAYADELLALLGKRKRINFIYRGNGDNRLLNVTQGVANRVADQLANLELKATFFVVEDLHDRVWMKRDRQQRWSANAVGTSRGGIGRRPTYILPMSPVDCREYQTFVDSLMMRAQRSHERPINFKKPSSKKVSNSGRIRKVGTSV